ncbi:SDR family oxidoreductase [Sphaerisporangium sp. NPDC005289]|uniref:SDR family oxidoreductase n=1 Tax=Sphaerisporangium sp. NPDC005289 TaxID=3155247 RepID=UPI0033A07B56
MARCLVTGATGYIGGRLVPELLEAGHAVRCMARSSARLRGQVWRDRVEVAEADATDLAATRAALEEVDVAFYLIHTMAAGRDFAERDRAAARTFAVAAREAGVRRIVYLGGLTPAERPSPHMRSRAEVEAILRCSGVPTVAYRASVIIGSGSVSFEMLRYLTERLPVMTTPRWVRTRTQPIAIRDVLRYLVRALDIPPGAERAYDIGGPDVLTYAQMMRGYAEAAGLPPRLIIPVPLLTPSLSSHWVGLVTPVPAGVARPLVESLRNEAVCREHDIARYIPDPPDGLTSFGQAVRLALLRIKEADVATRWSSASTPGAPSDPLPTDPDWAGGSLYIDERSRAVRASPEALWRVIEGIGGGNGWYSLPVAWWVRGLADRAVGGVGLRRGRRDPARLRVGDALDFWRVEEIEPGRLLRLRAEMRLPGLAWLELCCRREDGATVYGQRAIFHPRGLLGHLYWWAAYPFHGLIFGRMPGNVARAAEGGGAGGARTETFSEQSGVVPAQPGERGRPR